MVMRVTQSVEKVGILLEALAEKMRQGETAHLDDQMRTLLDTLPIYITQVDALTNSFPAQKWYLLSQCRSVLNAYPRVMGRPLSPEAAVLARRLNTITN
jgi:hypothetical protein